MAARAGRVITWHELGYWDGDGRWHMVAAYEKRETANGDVEKAQREFQFAVVCVRTYQKSLITE